LLLTASIHPEVFGTPLTVLTDPEIRWRQYENNLIRIIQEGFFKTIVFCENTGYPADYSVCIQKATEKGVNLECLIFEGSKRAIAAKGKGYGEGEILKHALTHSKVLQPQTVFYKLTGRIQIHNFKKIISCHQDDELVFMKADRSLPRVDTRFFKCSAGFFKEHLLNVYKEVNDPAENFLEMEYYRALHGLKLKCFKAYPLFIGISGSTGDSYKLSFLEHIKFNLYLKSGLLNV